MGVHYLAEITIKVRYINMCMGYIRVPEYSHSPHLQWRESRIEYNISAPFGFNKERRVKPICSLIQFVVHRSELRDHGLYDSSLVQAHK